MSRQLFMARTQISITTIQKTSLKTEVLKFGIQTEILLIYITRTVTLDEQLLACKHSGFRICKIFQPELAQGVDSYLWLELKFPLPPFKKLP